ncbi:hypothetical protein DFQ11_10852 [Winogradskyella epiphytica]|uniref:Lipoprotein n=1 Tax=Winogradskyella epiphytica TaxID=262005 RepID=A0A2V4WUC2_9FLAO|nr:hypothetical protein [Winogradskyella epiphytica]PYE80028.1 hypothetical protein DFQ11_10852 [Winogradskyella epiphytica]GGW73253.1 hypothetical protein GCM10008085_26900 [Winogradskyella epiphytica]
MKRTILGLFLTITLISCDKKEKELLSENTNLKFEIESLKKEIDSLNQLPSSEFEKIAIEDRILDSLRNVREHKYSPDLNLNKLKVSDSVLMSKYVNFAKENSGSILSLIAFDRATNVYHKGRTLNLNQIVGVWKLDSIKGLGFTKDYKTKINEKLEITKDKKINIYSNNKIIESNDFYLRGIKFGGTEMHIKGKGVYFVNLKKNNFLAIGKAYIMDSGYKVYEKSNE